jgi:hypothetical protein
MPAHELAQAGRSREDDDRQALLGFRNAWLPGYHSSWARACRAPCASEGRLAVTRKLQVSGDHLVSASRDRNGEAELASVRRSAGPRDDEAVQAMSVHLGRHRAHARR